MSSGAGRDAPRTTARLAPFAERVVLTKREVFAVCQVLADAGALAARCGAEEEVRRLGHLFELLEDRLTSRGGSAPSREVHPADYSCVGSGSSGELASGSCSDAVPSGTKSSERELTQ